jgi:hypothetical protein
MELTMTRLKVLLDEMEEKYKSQSNNKFSYNKMIQYFLQTTEISDYCNEFNKLDELEEDDDESSMTSFENNDEPEENKERKNNDDAPGGKDANDSDSEESSLEDEVELTLGDRVKQRWDHCKKINS